jgi:hypothetical protein
LAGGASHALHYGQFAALLMPIVVFDLDARLFETVQVPPLNLASRGLQRNNI